MNSEETIVTIKDKEGKILDTNQTIRVINNVKSEINPESRSETLNYRIQGNNVIIPKIDLIVLKVKLPRYYCSLV